MGTCASTHRNSDSSGKLRASLVHSETDKNPNTMPSTPVKKNLANVLVVDRPIGSQFSSVNSFSNYASKEEAFFDSQPWLESDCDDDFYSVNGDFTPSRGSTPLHTHSSTTLSPQVNRALFQGWSAAVDEPKVDTNCVDRQEHSGSPANTSSTEKKKKLADLFFESTRENQQDEFNHEAEAETPKYGNTTTPYMSGTNSQPSSAKRSPSETRPSEKSAQCCFLRLPSARGFKKTFFAAPPSIVVDA